MTAIMRVGVAGWGVPPDVAEGLGAGGSALERYASGFTCVEINSSFYRPHRPGTWARWAAATPGAFRFAVKAPRAITHEARLIGCEGAMRRFLEEAGRLGEKLGPILVQLPPSLAFDYEAASGFFAMLRALHGGALVCEPRHASWFAADADALLARHRVARAAANPALHSGAGIPGGWTGLTYRRWHGSPRMYFSAYGDEALAGLAQALLADRAEEAWCVFDNTGAGWAARNALALMERLASDPFFAPAGKEKPMAKLKAASRDKLPDKAFAEPDKRAYPIEDKAHAQNAKARASQAVKAGRMSKAEAGKIERKADAVIKKS